MHFVLYTGCDDSVGWGGRPEAMITCVLRIVSDLAPRLNLAARNPITTSGPAESNVAGKYLWWGGGFRDFSCSEIATGLDLGRKAMQDVAIPTGALSVAP